MAAAVDHPPLKALIVEDEEVPRAITITQLEQASPSGLDITCVDNAQDAAQAILGQEFSALTPSFTRRLPHSPSWFDVILMDCTMPSKPEMSPEPDQGIRVTEAARDAGSSALIIAHSGEPKEKLSRYRFSEIWSKGESVQRLRELMEKYNLIRTTGASSS